MLSGVLIGTGGYIMAERFLTDPGTLEGIAGMTLGSLVIEGGVRSGAMITARCASDYNREVFALPVEPVREVLRVTSITRVPHAPQPIRGVTNLRGRVIPVIDMR